MTERSTHEHTGSGCLFCNLPTEERRDLRVASFYGRFDNFPVSPGHLEVVPQRHIVSITDLEPEEWAELGRGIKNAVDLIENTDLRVIYQRIAKASFNDESRWFAKRALEHPRINTTPDAYTHGVNDGKAAGRTVDHLHWHVIPRYEGDVDDPTGGVRYVIPEMGNYKGQRQ